MGVVVVQDVLLVPLLIHETVQVSPDICNNRMVSGLAQTVPSEVFESGRDTRVEGRGDLRQAYAVGYRTVTLGEELLGDPFDDSARITGLLKCDAGQHLVRSLDLTLESMLLGLRGRSALLGEETRPIRVQDQQVVGEKLPILLVGKEFPLTEAENFGASV